MAAQLWERVAGDEAAEGDDHEYVVTAAAPTSPGRRRVPLLAKLVVGVLLALSGAVLALPAGRATTSTFLQRVPSSSEEALRLWQSRRQSRQSKATLPFVIQECSKEHGCEKKDVFLTLDQDWRWWHDPKTQKNCKRGCENCDYCTIDGDVDYEKNGVKVVDSDKVIMTKGVRILLLDSGEDNYYMLNMVGKEISFDIDVSHLPCGMNSAIYTVEMEKDGGYEGGSRLGTGYCDAQCPQAGTTWKGKSTVGKVPVCCNEFDIWEGNRLTTAFTAHPCMMEDGKDMVGPYECKGKECNSHKDGTRCDGFGCDFNAYRNGATAFYGNGTTFSGVDTTRPFTVTTQLLANTTSGADRGSLVEVRRSYVQDGKKIDNPKTSVANGTYDSLTDDYCEVVLKEYENTTTDPNTTKCNSDPVGEGIFTGKGGLGRYTGSFNRGNVLVVSLWNDPWCNMLWLDGIHGEGPGGERGPCGSLDESGDFAKGGTGYSVTISNLRVGDMGTTTSA